MLVLDANILIFVGIILLIAGAISLFIWGLEP